VAHVRQGPRPLRQFSRNTKPRSRRRRSRLLRSRRNRSRVRPSRRNRCRVRQGRPSRSKPRHRLNQDRNRRPAARPRTLPLKPNPVLHHRRQPLPMLGRPLVRYPFGIRRSHQHLNKASGRGWGLVGRPSGLRAMRLLRLHSNLEFLPRSRRQPHPVGRMRRPRRYVRALRPVSRLVRRRSHSRGRRLEPRLGISLRHPRLRVLQRLLLW
jgi:hypothetical protein